MLNILTQAAIAALHDISSKAVLQSENLPLSREEWEQLLHQLEHGGLIRPLPGNDLLSSNRPQPGSAGSEASPFLRYTLRRPLTELSLLDVLEATGEPIHCHRPTPEDFYTRHAAVAQKIGVLNRVARMFLAEIKISDW